MSEPQFINLSYVQAQHDYLAGNYPVVREDAAQVRVGACVYLLFELMLLHQGPCRHGTLVPAAAQQRCCLLLNLQCCAMLARVETAMLQLVLLSLQQPCPADACVCALPALIGMRQPAIATADGCAAAAC